MATVAIEEANQPHMECKVVIWQNNLLIKRMCSILFLVFFN